VLLPVQALVHVEWSRCASNIMSLLTGNRLTHPDREVAEAILTRLYDQTAVLKESEPETIHVRSFGGQWKKKYETANKRVDQWVVNDKLVQGLCTKRNCQADQLFMEVLDWLIAPHPLRNDTRTRSNMIKSAYRSWERPPGPLPEQHRE